MISVTTALPQTHVPFIYDAYKSLCEQTVQDWEWVIVENNGGEVPADIQDDKRVKVIKYNNNLEERICIGAVKFLANSSVSNELIVELDGDDFLLPIALERVIEVFKDPEVHYAYSNNCDFNDKWESRYFSEYWGWKKREFIYEGHKLWEMRDFEPCAQNFRYIYWQPDHLKAWRKSSYMELGGHDPKIFVCDDQDLCCRYYIKYGAKGFKFIDECLYMYRMHSNNSCVVYNKDVQINGEALYKKYIYSMAERWAEDENLLKVDLGGGLFPKKNYLTVDYRDTANIKCDLNDTWPLPDNSVGVLRASHIVEHLKDPIHTMNEAYRILAPGGFMFIDVPSTDGRGAFQDPTHCSWWNENSFSYYTNQQYAVYIQPQFKGKFQVSRLFTYKIKPDIPVVRADLIAVKTPYKEKAAGRILI